jgi:hypothetical protein
MAVGGIRGGGRGGKGPRGVGGKAGTSKASAGSFSKASGTQGASGAGGAGDVGGSDPVAAQAAAIAKALRAGEISSKSEAAQKLVTGILRDRLKISSKSLSKRISDHLQDDPRLSQTLERIWAKG